MHIITCPEIGEAEQWPEEMLAVPFPEIRQLIQIRWLQNELNRKEKQGYIISRFIVVETNDALDWVEQEICSSLRRIKTADGKPLDDVFTPSFEWIVTHPSCYEVAYIHCDREVGVCLLIPIISGMHPDLLEMGASYGQPVPSI